MLRSLVGSEMCIRDSTRMGMGDHSSVKENVAKPTDGLEEAQLQLLKLIRDKIYARSYNLTQVFRGFNNQSSGSSGALPLEMVVNGLRKMINMGDGNAKLDADLGVLAGLCVSEGPNGPCVTYEHFSYIFKIDDEQGTPLLEGSTSDRFLWGGHASGSSAGDMCFNRQGKLGILNDNARTTRSAYTPIGNLR
eukprot:TRINITY_DN4919_c0_g1_i4.p1 TRINITY_DN4919_c0_g1~~TRINITY_DN4919_c0_g1_i4.p1  ORF type:complete len:192 (+),score=36.59 TRINITY_DN4919_c0_g1_i4:120-695(+)